PIVRMPELLVTLGIDNRHHVQIERAVPLIATAFCQIQHEGVQQHVSIMKGIIGLTGKLDSLTCQLNDGSTGTATNLQNPDGDGTSEPTPIIVPTWFHIASNGTEGYMSDAAIKAQIYVVTAAYAGNVKFVHARTTRQSNAKWFVAEIPRLTLLARLLLLCVRPQRSKPPPPTNKPGTTAATGTGPVVGTSSSQCCNKTMYFYQVSSWIVCVKKPFNSLYIE
ncbi:UNVERIFIED_CONTAM: hypothetical protein HDU68_005437, partial [Siphonaria sp. JEL0065]